MFKVLKLLFLTLCIMQVIATVEVLGRSPESADTALHGVVVGTSESGLLEVTLSLVTDRLEIPAVRV